MAVKDLIHNTIADNILARGSEEASNVYDCFAPTKVKNILAKMDIDASVFIYPFPNDDCLLPDNWCCITWKQDGIYRSFGFNFMSADREVELRDFNDTYYHGH